MCQYSSKDGHPTDWHLVHLGSRAVGGAGLVMVEATAVTPVGRISPDDSGIWSDDHIPGFRRISHFLNANGAAAGIQIAHAGRKASTAVPWLGRGVLAESERGWQTIAPSPVPFDEGEPLPHEMSSEEIKEAVRDFEAAARRSLEAGFKVLELHMAHGYLMHEFLSPISNQRTDEYGGNLENRMRFPLEVAAAVRKVWPNSLPLFARISATDWARGPSELEENAPRSGSQESWDLWQSIELSKKLKAIGIDLIDCSSGGTLPKANIPTFPGYQVPFAAAIRKEVNILVAAVGLITEVEQVEEILRSGKADAVFMARESLRDPYWPLHAAKKLGVKMEKPVQYGRS